MADDIVTRLRQEAAQCNASPCDCQCPNLIAAADEIERLRAALLKYGTQSHYSCEDSWYSCPKSADGCCDDRQGDECNCGADEHNAEVRRIVAEESGVVCDDCKEARRG